LSRGAHRKPQRARRRVVIGTAVAAIASLAGMQVGNAATPTPNGTCTMSAKLVPSCGVLWGTSGGDNGSTSTTTLESQINRKFAFVYHFHGIDETNIPNSAEKYLSSQGRYLHINLESRRYVTCCGGVYYSDITAGKLDSALKAQAANFKALGKPVFVTFDHEPDTKQKWGQHGSAAQFVAAWRHIVTVYRNAGATNVVWVWTVTGWKGNWTKEDQLWPGSSYVDWISWDPYNLAGCQDGTINYDQWISFQQSFKDSYAWFKKGGTYGEIDGSKPFMFSEFGTVTDYAHISATANWYAAVPSTLKSYPQIKAVTQFNVKRDCDFRISSNSTVLSSYRNAGLNTYVNP
jgi:hypothetical protein